MAKRVRVEFDLDVEGDLSLEQIAAYAADLMMNEALEFGLVDTETNVKHQFNTEDFV